MNRVEVRGRVGQNPRISNVGDSSVARFSLATNEIFKDRSGDIREETTWHNITVWSGKGISDFAEIKKGSMVYVLGRIRNVKYNSPEGEERHYQEIVANKMEVVSPLDLKSQQSM